MSAFGGKFHWGRNEGAQAGGIVVVFAWMCSEEKHLKSYVKLYSSLGWDSFVCHSGCFNLFAPSKAASLAFDLVNALVKELKTRPCPIVFASFSGGPKACMYKVLQIIDGNCDPHRFLDDYRLVKECLAGQIYDSCPVDFYSELALEFFLHPSVIGGYHPPKLLTWTLSSIRAGLDALFINWAEAQRADYWRTLYASASIGAPYLILCSENDDLAACEAICHFAKRLEELGADVKLLKWGSSPHVGHYRMHPVEYRAAVTELLEKAALVYSLRLEALKGRAGCGEASKPDSGAREAARGSDERLCGLASKASGQSLVPSSSGCHAGMDVGLVEDDEGEGSGGFIGFLTPNGWGCGLTGRVDFDEACPKNIEDWDATDLGPVDLSEGVPLALAWRGMRHSKL